jgi:hypothetical protein
LDACYFGAGGWGELCDFGARKEEVFEGGVRAFAMFYVLEGFDWNEGFTVVPGWEVVGVLYVMS